MSGLSIEEDAGEAIEATTGVLGGCRFVAHGAVVLDDEISARGDDDDDAAATTTTTAAADDVPGRDDASAGLLLGRMRSRNYDDFDDDDALDDDDLLSRLPPGMDPRRDRARIRPAARPRCLLFPGVTRDAIDHDEEVYARGNHVVWSSGGVVRVRFTTPEPVSQVAWCAFPRIVRITYDPSDPSDPSDVGFLASADDEPTLCLRHGRTAMTTYAPSGATQTMPLPRDARGDLAPTALGALLRTSRGVAAIRHALDEPSLVFAADPADVFARTETIAWSSVDSVLLLTHDAGRASHALWRLSPAAERREGEGERGEKRESAGTTGARDGDGDDDDDAWNFLSTEPSTRAGRPFGEYFSTTAGLKSGGVLLDVDVDDDGEEGDGEEGDGDGSPNSVLGGSRSRARAYSQAEHPRVAATRVWTEPPGRSPSPASHAALTHADDARGTPALAALLADGALVGWSLRRAGAGAGAGGDAAPRVVFAIDDVVSFAAAAATRAPLLDVLVKRADPGRDALGLFAGARCVMSWDASATLWRDAAAGVVRVGDVVRVHSPVGNRVTAETTAARGGIAVRLSLPTGFASPAARAVMDAAGKDVMRALDAGAGEASASATAAVVAAAASAAASGSGFGSGDAAEWNAVRDALLRLCSIDTTAAEEDGYGNDIGGGRDADADDAAWNELLADGDRVAAAATARKYRALASSLPPPAASPPTRAAAFAARASMPPPRDATMALLESSHAAYEACKLDALKRPATARVGELCAALAGAIARDARSGGSSSSVAGAIAIAHLDHYARDGGANGGAARTLAAMGRERPGVASSPAPPPTPTPDLVRALEMIFEGVDESAWIARVPPLIAARLTGDGEEGGDAIAWAADVVSFASAAAASAAAASAGDDAEAAEAATAMTAAMTTSGFGLAELSRLPHGVSVPLRDALQRCRRSPPGGWPAAAYALVGRDDLALKAAFESSSSPAPSHSVAGNLSTAASHDLRARGVFLPGVGVGAGGGDGVGADDDEHGGGGGGDGDGGHDLDDGDGDGGAEKSFNATDGGSGGGDGDELEPDGMSHLESYVGPLLFGRDRRLREVRALLSSARPTPILLGGLEGGGGGADGGGGEGGDAEAVSAQQARLWSLAPRTSALAIGRGAFTLGTARARPTEALKIPTLTLAGCLPAHRNAVVKLDLAAVGEGAAFTLWPEFHNGAAAGFALAARTKGELTRAWIVFNRPREPSHAHAGVLMALGLTGHLRALTNTDMYRYLVQEHEATTVGVLIGTAAAHRGTMNPETSKMCFLHLPTRHPGSFPEVELSTQVQSAALLSVGLVYEGSAHRLMSEILLAEIGKEPGGDSSPQGREGYALSAGLALGLVTLGRGRDAIGLVDLRIPERLRRYLGGGGGEFGRRPRESSFRADEFAAKDARARDDANGNGGGQVMENALVNLDVTAPAATLALGLMFLKTNDAAAAAHVAVPSTHYALDHARPDFVLLRVVAKSLIMWDSIDPHEAWVEAQLPEILRLKKTSSRASPDAIEFQGEDDDGGHGGPTGAAVDREALAQAHVHALAGACMTLGLRFAGTADAVAANTLTTYALTFLRCVLSHTGPHTTPSAW